MKGFDLNTTQIKKPSLLFGVISRAGKILFWPFTIAILAISVVFFQALVYEWKKSSFCVLNTVLVTNIIYFLFFLVAIVTAKLALQQITLTTKVSSLNAILVVYKYIYDERLLNIKGAIKENHKINSDIFNAFVPDMTKEDFDAKYMELDTKIKAFSAPLHPLPKGVHDINFIISIYNNIYFLIEQQYLKENDLPIAFHANSRWFYEIFKRYIYARNKNYPGQSYATYYTQYCAPTIYRN